MSVIKQDLKKDFGVFRPFNIRRSKKVDYLRTVIDFVKHSKLLVSIIKYMTDIFSSKIEVIVKIIATPAAYYIFIIREKAIKLSKSIAEIFQYNTAKILYVSRHRCIAVLFLVYLLTTYVKMTNEYNWKSLSGAISI